MPTPAPLQHNVVATTSSGGTPNTVSAAFGSNNSAGSLLIAGVGINLAAASISGITRFARELLVKGGREYLNRARWRDLVRSEFQGRRQYSYDYDHWNDCRAHHHCRFSRGFEYRQLRVHS